jgi:hypothetical protein
MWEAEIGRTVVGSQLRQIVCEMPSPKYTRAKMGWRCGSKPLSSNPRPTKKT